MSRAIAWTIALLAAATCAACGRGDPEPTAAKGDADDSALLVSIGVGSLGFSRDSVRIRPDGVPEARIRAGGRLEIDGREVPVTEAQRAQLVAYHTAAMQLAEHGKDTGIAGAKVGVAAIGAVISGLAQGDPDSIGPKVEAEAEKVKQAALKLCEDMAMMRQAQEALAADLEVFRPYATIDEDDVADCRHGVDAGDAPPATNVRVTPPRTCRDAVVAAVGSRAGNPVLRGYQAHDADEHAVRVESDDLHQRHGRG